MDKIKQNLKFRSGRHKKEQISPPRRVKIVAQQPLSAHPPTPPPGSGSRPTSAADSRPATAESRPPTRSELPRQISKPNNRSFQNHSEIPERRIEIPQRSPPVKEEQTMERPSDVPRRKSTRYGRSGIELYSPDEKVADIQEYPMSQAQSNAYSNAQSNTQESNPVYGNHTLYHAQSLEMLDFDLSPPTPTEKAPKPTSIESLSELLFSPEHLKAIIHTPNLLTQFTTFLQKYRTVDHPLLHRYLETQKAIKAVAYANAVVEGLPPVDASGQYKRLSQPPKIAAILDDEFEAFCTEAFSNLTATALPMFVTFSLIRVVSDLLATAMTNRTSQTLHDSVEGLSEVFCLTDPNQKDNPIIYASEEFFQMTRYSQNDVLGYNCRFLQGPRTSHAAVDRLRTAIRNGEESCEALLNYRRDGRPFINLLMIAPLHDDQGNVKYYLGAQVDVSGLVEDGRGLESFHRTLARKDIESRPKRSSQSRANENYQKQRILASLRDLSEMFDLEESAVIQEASRAGSVNGDDDTHSISSIERPNSSRRMYVDAESSEQDEEEQDDEEAGEHETWNLASGLNKLSGRLPGIYENYMLIRPAPSLRIVFVSSKLKHAGKIVQSPFMSHIAASSGTLTGLKKSFASGTPVTARVQFLPERGPDRDGLKLSSSKRDDRKPGRTCWISCTPLMRGDEKIGVWMIVFVEEAQQKSDLARHMSPDASGDRLATYARQGDKHGNQQRPESRAAHYGQGHNSTQTRKTVEKPTKPTSSKPIEQVSDKPIAKDYPTHFEEKEKPAQQAITEPERTKSPTSSYLVGEKDETEQQKGGDEVVEESAPQEYAPQHAEDPVSEYHEIKRDYQHVPGTQTPPLSPPGQEFNENGQSSEGDIIQNRQSSINQDTSERVVIQPDSDVEGESVEEKVNRMGAEVYEEPIKSVPIYEPPSDDSPRSIPSDAQFANESDEMPRRRSEIDPQELTRETQRKDDNYRQDLEDPNAERSQSPVISEPSDRGGPIDEPQITPPNEPEIADEVYSKDRPTSPTNVEERPTSSQSQTTGRPVSPSSNYRSNNNNLTLEYVLMPSRQSTEQTIRGGMSGGWQVRSKRTSEDESTTDDCARSPYSVD